MMMISFRFSLQFCLSGSFALNQKFAAFTTSSGKVLLSCSAPSCHNHVFCGFVDEEEIKTQRGESRKFIAKKKMEQSPAVTFWLVAVILLVTAITQLSQLELFEQQRVALQSGVGSKEKLDALKADGQVSPAAAPCAADDSKSDINKKSTTSTAIASDYVLRSLCYMDEVFHVPQILRFAVMNNFSYYDPMITTPPGSYVLSVTALHMLKPPPNEAAGRKVASLHPSAAGMDRADDVGGLYDGSAVLPFVLQWRSVDVCADARVVDERLPLWAQGIIGPLWLLSCGVARRALDAAFEALHGVGVPSHWIRRVQMYWYPNSFGALVHVLRRLGSSVHAIGWILVLWLALRLRHGGVAAWGVVLSAIYPPLLLSTLLVYTDSISSLCVVLMMLVSSSGMDRTSPSMVLRMITTASIGLFAITVRQTNIVWLFFVSGRFFLERMLLSGDAINVRRLVTTLAVLMPSVVVAGCFIAFLIWNEGIVLGDKTNHQPVTQLAQLSYLGATCAVFFPFQTLLAVHQQIFIRRRFAAMFVMTAFIAPSLTVSGGLAFHPYLVADNRHYTNVIYRKVLQDDMIRMHVLVPLATLGWVFLLDLFVGVSNTDDWHKDESVSILNHSGKKTTVVPLNRIFSFRAALFALFVVCSAICCVPQKLMEFRYFVPCVTVALTSVKFFSLGRSVVYRRYAQNARLLDTAVAVLIHAVCCLVFLYRTFTAPDGSVGRFVW